MGRKEKYFLLTETANDSQIHRETLGQVEGGDCGMDCISCFFCNKIHVSNCTCFWPPPTSNNPLNDDGGATVHELSSVGVCYGGGRLPD